MSGLEAVMHNDPRVNTQTAAGLYIARWQGILGQEWGLNGEGLYTLALMQQSNRCIIFPEGQRAAVDGDGSLAGTIYSIAVNSDQLARIASWEALTGRGYGSTHTPSGDSLICYAVQTDPGVRGGFRALVEAQAELARTLGLRLFVFTRPNGFSSFAQENGLSLQEPASMEDYLRQVTEGGLVVREDGVSAHTHLGATLAPLLRGGKPYLHGSRPADKDSAGYNVLMEYPVKG